MSKSVFVFDWDGTIFDSMDIKLVNFSSVLSKHCNLSYNEIKEFYKKYSGIPRREILMSLFKNYRLQVMNCNINIISDEISSKNKKALKNARIFNDFKNLFKILKKLDKKICISSSQKQDELDYFIEKKLNKVFKNYISCTLGTIDDFTKGPRHINFIRKKLNCSLNKIIFIGDDKKDMDLACLAKVDSLWIDRNKEYKNFEFPNIINTFDEIKFDQ